MGNCGGSEQKPSSQGDDIRIANDSRQRTRQTTSIAVGTTQAPANLTVPDVSKSATDRRTLENEMLRSIVSLTNKNFIGVSSLGGFETPPGADEASKRYQSILQSAPPRMLPASIPFPSRHNESKTLPCLLDPTEIPPQDEQFIIDSSKTLISTIEEINIPINPSELVVEWSVAASLQNYDDMMRKN